MSILHFDGFTINNHDHKRIAEAVKLISEVENQTEHDSIGILLRMGMAAYSDFFSSLLWDGDKDSKDDKIKYDEIEDKYYWVREVRV